MFVWGGGEGVNLTYILFGQRKNPRLNFQKQSRNYNVTLLHPRGQGDNVIIVKKFITIIITIHTPILRTQKKTFWQKKSTKTGYLRQI